MTQTVFFISLALFLYLVWLLVLGAMFRKQVNLAERLEGIRHDEQEDELLVEKEPKKGLIRIPKVFVPEKLREMLRLSGLDIRVDDFVFLWVFMVLVPGSLVFVLLGKAVLAVLLAALMTVFPIFLLWFLANRQKKIFENQLGDALTIISNALRAGHSLPQSLLSVTETLPDPINREFLQASREIRLGSTVVEALGGVSERMASKDLGLLITAIEVQQRVGGNLSEIMDTISKTIRDRMNLKRTVGSMTAQGKTSGLVVGLLPLILIVVVNIMSPGYIDPLFESSIGKIILGAGAVMEVVGYLIIFKMVNVKM